MAVQRDGSSRKLSQLNAETTIADDAIVYFVTATGTKSRKMRFGDLKAAFGVTGSIASTGDPAGTPVLIEIGPNTYEIRIFEPGPGISASVSPQDGLLVEHGFVQSTVGQPVLVNPTDANPIIASVVAGVGITVSSPSPGVIQVAAPGLVTASSVVIVNQMADFPAPDAGVITLADNTEYLVSANLTTADRFVLGNNCVLNGSNSRTNSITYTGSDVMISGIDVVAEVSRLRIVCASGTLFDLSCSTGECRFLAQSLQVDDVATIGNVADTLLFQLIQSSFDNISVNGLTFSGANGILQMERFLATLIAGNFCDLGTATFSSVLLENCVGDLSAGTNFLTGLPGSGNIDAGGLGSITNGRFSGAGSPLNSITTDDARWQFALNDDIPDTRPDGLLSANGPFVVTIPAANTPVKVSAGAASWIVERTSQMTGSDTGTLTYDGGKDIAMPLTGNISAEPVTGTNKVITFYLAKGAGPLTAGDIIANSGAVTTVSAGAPKNTPIPWQELIQPGEDIEIWVENNSDATNLQINSGVLRVN